MAKFAWKDVSLTVGGVDLSCDTSATTVELTCAAEEVTAFCGDGVREYVNGLKAGAFTHEGFWDPLITADVVYQRVRAASDVVPTSFAVSKQAGARAYTGATLHTQYTENAPVGAPYNYSAAGVISGAVARGRLLAPATDVSASGTGTPVQVGAAPEGIAVYSSLHVVSVEGGSSPSIALTADSASTEGFAGGVTRLTHATLNDAGSDFQTLEGPVTDTWWRSAYTITGSPDAIRFVHVLGFATA